MAKRPTIADLARAAGVGTATVDRVLNGRLPVRPETAKRVRDAARAIGYHGRDLIDRRVDGGLANLSVGLVMNARPSAFARDVAAACEQVAAAEREAVARCVTVRATDGVRAAIDGMVGRVDALALLTPAGPEAAPALARMRALGVPCLTLVDAGGQDQGPVYVGIDNLRAGRIAAHLCLTSSGGAGPVALMGRTGGGAAQDLREAGFRGVLRARAPEVPVLDVMVPEGEETSGEMLMRLLSRTGDLRAVYCMAEGLDGAVDALRDAGRRAESVLVASELTEAARAGLADRVVDLVTATPMDALARQLFEAGRTRAAPSAALLRPELLLPGLLD